MAFSKVLEAPPAFQEFQDFVSAATLKPFHAICEKVGPLNMTALVSDKYLQVLRVVNTNKFIPITTARQKDEKSCREISFGQHTSSKGSNNLNGVGRKIKIWTNGAGCIWDGQFKNNKLTFGRCMKKNQNEQDFTCYMGHWKDDRLHGYGKEIHTDGKAIEGLFENDGWIHGMLKES